MIVWEGGKKSSHRISHTTSVIGIVARNIKLIKNMFHQSEKSDRKTNAVQ